MTTNQTTAPHRAELYGPDLDTARGPFTTMATTTHDHSFSLPLHGKSDGSQTGTNATYRTIDTAHETIDVPILVVDGSESGRSSRSSGYDVSTSRLTTPGSVYDGSLYVGSYRDVCDEEKMLEHGIRAYLCVAKELSPPLPPHVDEAQVAMGEIAFLHLPLEDVATTQLEDYFETVFSFIDEQERAGRPTVIYCQQGKSRSVSLAMAYLMRRECLDVDDALTELRLGYPAADPNVFFIAQLQGWHDRSIKKKSTQV